MMCANLRVGQQPLAHPSLSKFVQFPAASLFGRRQMRSRLAEVHDDAWSLPSVPTVASWPLPSRPLAAAAKKRLGAPCIRNFPVKFVAPSIHLCAPAPLMDGACFLICWTVLPSA